MSGVPEVQNGGGSRAHSLGSCVLRHSDSAPYFGGAGRAIGSGTITYSYPAGDVHVAIRFASRTTIQSVRCFALWCFGHAGPRFARLVSPPSHHAIV